MQAAETAAIDGEGAPSERRAAPSALVLGVLLALITILALLLYKWSGSLRVLRVVTSTHVLDKSPKPLLVGAPWVTTLRYFRIVWPALVLGLLIGATVRAGVPSRWVTSLFERRKRASIAIGGLAGAPLMLCSCCVTPIGTGLRERGASLGSSLALTLGSPGLNPAALILTFLLFPSRMAILRLVGAATIVFGVSALAGMLGAKRSFEPTIDDGQAGSVADLARRFVGSLGRLFVLTVPLIAVGVFLSSLLLPLAPKLGSMSSVSVLVTVAALATLVALPTFFEIPLAILLLQLGAPPSAATALLIAGPIINLPSLLVLGRESGPKVAAFVGVGVALVSVLAGAFSS